MKKNKTWLVYLILFGVIAIMATSFYNMTANKPDTLSYQEFVQLVKDDKIEGARVTLKSEKKGVLSEMLASPQE